MYKRCTCNYINCCCNYFYRCIDGQCYPNTSKCIRVFWVTNRSGCLPGCFFSFHSDQDFLKNNEEFEDHYKKNLTWSCCSSYGVRRN